MSLKSREAKKLATAGIVAIAALGVSAAGAQAGVKKQLTYNCLYPLVGENPLTIDIDAEIPTSWPVKTPTDQFVINAVATAAGQTADAIDSLDARYISGTSFAYSDLTFPSGKQQKGVKVTLKVAEWARPPVSQPVPNPLVLSASGTTPKLTFPEIGKTAITVERIELSLTALDRNRKPIDVLKLEEDLDGNPVTDSDDDPNTFDVYCELNPATQSKKLVDINVTGGGVVNTAPTVPGAASIDGAATETTLPLTWAASTDAQGNAITYDVFVNGTKKNTTPITGNKFTASGLTKNTTYQITVSATDNATPPLTSAVSTASALKTAGDAPQGPDVTKPTKPIEVALVRGTDFGKDFINVKWGASTDPVVAGAITSGVKEYIVTSEGEDGAIDTIVPAGTLNKRFDGLGQDSDYRYTIVARDNAGNESDPLDLLLITEGEDEEPPVDAVPGAPTGVTAGTATETSIPLSWTAATDDKGISGYNVFVNGALKKSTTGTGTSTTVDGLVQDTEYTIEVQAIDTKPQTGAKSASIKARTAKEVIVDPGCGSGIVCYSYTIKGNTVLKTLTKGTLPITGGIDAKLTTSTGAFTGDLKLNDTQGRLTSAGFLPVTVKIGFVPSGKTTGNLTSGQILTANTKVRIKVKEVKLFGAIPLAGGNNCQTKSLSDINLASVGKFPPLTGGTLAGTFAISDLNGCGILNGLVSPLTAGKGNTLSLGLTPVKK